jgi:hypothetical protein
MPSFRVKWQGVVECDENEGMRSVEEFIEDLKEQGLWHEIAGGYVRFETLDPTTGKWKKTHVYTGETGLVEASKYRAIWKKVQEEGAAYREAHKP